MSIFRKIFTAFRGGANEMGEAVVDANAIRIFEQELRDAKTELAKAKESEIDLLARKKQAEAKVNKLGEQASEYESHARAALDKGDEALALETAERVAKLENEKADYLTQVDSLTSSCSKIRSQIAKAEADINEMENQLSQIKATDTVQKAQETIHNNINAGNSSVVSARESLERIKAKQEAFDAKQAAAEELETQSDLDKKLSEAGIKSSGASAKDILAKLKAEKE